MNQQSTTTAVAILIALSGCTTSDDAVPAAVLSIPAASLNLLADYHQSTGGKSLYIMQDGEVILEKYDNGGAASQQQMLASGTKSFNGIVAAAAITDGLITFDASPMRIL